MPLLAAVILLLFSALAAGQSGPVDNVEHIATVHGLRDPAVDATFADQVDLSDAQSLCSDYLTANNANMEVCAEEVQAMSSRATGECPETCMVFLMDMPMECQAAVVAILPQTVGTLNLSESLLWVDLKCGSGFSSATGTGALAPILSPVEAPAEQPAAAAQGDDAGPDVGGALTGGGALPVPTAAAASLRCGIAALATAAAAAAVAFL
ncbi:hypothetical protein D9Q98_007253 [Chlorella vulgaris]|uniref:Uncharacterized protein n=1 Tax=Chlorella vulgaris TaxID=3077 RepID=A0A9D4YVE7_CHLVU|nr:hypothetical protein D9Q98_007253 [Chlorella vulgaris]